jgi:hypothetical protein
MPSAVAVITGLTANGTDLQDFPRIFLQITEGGPGSSPEVRGDNRTIPYRRGQLYAPKRANRLPIGLTGWVSGVGTTEAAARADTAAARAALATLFDVEAGEVTLVCVTEDGTTWTAIAYTEVFLPEWQPVVPIHVGISVRLIAIDPPEWTPSGS